VRSATGGVMSSRSIRRASVSDFSRSGRLREDLPRWVLPRTVLRPSAFGQASLRVA
jgi:hypothetical protein